MSKQPFHIPSLDGMRAVAFLLVFLSHAGLGNVLPGGMGVTIFFFLSGYLITTLLRREFERAGRIDFKQFYIRRMLRIWPSFYGVLALGGLVTLAGWLPGEIRVWPFLGQVLHVTNYYAISHGDDGVTLGTSVYWSLAVEEHYYLLFPLLYQFLAWRGLRARGQALVFASLCLAALAWRYYLAIHLHVSEHRTYYATDTRVDSIMFGCILAVWRNPVLDPHRHSERFLKWLALPAGLALIGLSLWLRSPDFRETARYSTQGLALFPIFVAAIRLPAWGPFRILNSQALRLLGLISYPLYLVHFTVIRTLVQRAPTMPPLTQGVLAFLISLALASAIYLLIEAPVARLRKKHQAAC